MRRADAPVPGTRVGRRAALAALGALAWELGTGRGHADPVRIGRLVEIPAGIDPRHPEAMELGAARNGLSPAAIPERAPRLAWEREILAAVDRRASRARPPIVSSGGAILIGAPQGLVCLGIEGGERWIAAVGPVEVSPVLVPGGDVVACVRGGRVVRLSPEGAIRASVELGAGIAGAPLALDDGSVIVVGADRSVRRLDTSLRERWRVLLPGGVARPPTRHGAHVVVVAGQDVIALDDAGEIVRSQTLGDRAVSSAARAPDGALWLTTAHGALLALDARWRERTRLALGPTQLDDEAPAIALDGSVRVPVRTGVLCVAPDGEVRWEARTGASIDFPLRVDARGWTLLVDRTPELCAIDERGEVAWRARVSGHVMAAPVVTFRGEVVLVDAHGGVSVYSPAPAP